jgi:flagellar basal-body rod modification protein FlgD
MTTTTAIGSSAATATTAVSSATSGTDMKDASDRFLKLLVTQLQNQDPLNPTDNAQLTSQMAQINTVQGINTLNSTMSTMGASLNQMQVMQGASLVGHQVLMEGNKLSMRTDGTGVGGYELDAAATNVKIEITNAAGSVVGTINAGTRAAGSNEFAWTPPDGVDTSNLSFKVTATSGSKAITSTPIMSDTVDAVSNTNGSLTLELRNAGSTAYSKIKSVS